MELDVMQEFPLLSSWQGHKYWTGFINCQSLLVRLALQVPNFPSSQGINVEGDDDTIHIFKLCKERIQTVVNSNIPFLQFLKQVQSIIEEQIKATGTTSNTSELRNDGEFYTALFNELEQIGHCNVENASKDFGNLSIKYIDEQNRKHILRLQMPSQYPKSSPKISVELPQPQDFYSWPGKVLEVYDKFKKEVGKYGDFWDAMDEVDNAVRVIDPIQPNPSDTYRRILVTHNVLLSLVVNPLNPASFPELKFSGPEKAVEELEMKLDKNCKRWVDSNPIITNLENILECDFIPKFDMGNEEVEETTCVICYVFEFEGKIPDTTCECGSVYHEKCLSDLLVNDCSVKAIRLCVDCPVCGMEIKVSSAKNTGW